MLSWLARFGVVLALILAPANGLAQTRDAAAAEALFREGRKAMADGDYRLACDRFEESQRLDPGAGTLINLAACYEKQGRVATAWDRWSQALRFLKKADPRRPRVEEMLKAAEARLPKLIVTLAEGSPDGTTVRRDGVELGPASLGLPLPVDPGTRALEVLAPGHEAKRYSVEAKEGEVAEIEVGVGPALPPEPKPAAPATAPAPEPPPVRADPPPEAKPSVLGWVIGGAGVAALGVGAATGIVAIQKKNEVDDNCERVDGDLLCNDAGLSAADKGDTMALVSTVGFAVGAAGVGVGLFLILRRNGTETAAVGARPIPGGGALDLRATF